MTVSSRQWVFGALFVSAALVAAGLVCLVNVDDSERATTCAPLAPVISSARSTAAGEPIELSTPRTRANPELPAERISPVVQPVVQPTDLADPEEQLIAGNVDLATRALQLAQQRAANPSGLAAAEHEYELAAAKQSARAREAGYPSADANQGPQ